MNTDNRLLASGFRALLEPAVARFISRYQRGLIQRRSMLRNIIDIDFNSMRISLKHDQAAIVLFDFEAASPTISHDYLWEALRVAGVPSSFI